MIVVEFGFDDTDHRGLADLEGPGGEHAFTPGISALELVAAAHVACPPQPRRWASAHPGWLGFPAGWPRGGRAGSSRQIRCAGGADDR